MRQIGNQEGGVEYKMRFKDSLVGEMKRVGLLCFTRIFSGGDTFTLELGVDKIIVDSFFLHFFLDKECFLGYGGFTIR
ncbi:MAG: hypothetical protein GTN76_02170 [Candidatus Aenigmarchaeota archaeon]|nr:hypothetical protein [Candidatus Aenigmarchaeota archaeon]